MNKLGIFTIPTEVLSEMEALKIQGGAGSEGKGGAFILSACVLNAPGAYCGNCAPQCACDDSGDDDGDDTGDKGDGGGSSDRP